MSDNKLDSWLQNQGLSKPTANKSEASSKPQPKKKNYTSSKPPSKSNPTKDPTPNTNKPKPNQNPKKTNPNSRNKKPSFSGNKKQKFSNNDPFYARPTVEKRDKHHPTNFINTKGKNPIRIVPLGGMEQVGENMMFLEWENDIVVIDTGFLFPSPEHLGIDVLIPDVSYLVKNKHKIRGIIYTHGHLDHIGGTPYIVPQLGYPPMYASRLTKELILGQVEEHNGMAKKVKITEINPKSKIKLGKFEFEFFHINHSIPDGLAIVAKTPYGNIVHSSDFKFDYNPSDDQPIDLARIAQIGKSGVALAMVDSTNAMKPGHPISESVIEESLSKIVKETSGRLIIASFASNIGRVAKIIEAAEKYGRTVFLSGRSMEKNMAIARKLNYLRCKDKTLQRMGPKAEKMDPGKVLILSTGSQGEELAALTRMAAKTHKDIHLRPDDTVVFSSSTIPGNEMAIVSVLNNLADLEVQVIDKKEMDLHVSGHAHAEQCKLMTSLLNPKYFAPIHGETFMRYGHRDLIVQDLEFPKENTFIMKNGRGIILDPKGARLMNEKEVVSGPDILIELGETVGEHVLSDRQLMADSGIILVSVIHQKGSLKKVNIRSRGFIYMNLKHKIFDLLGKEVRDTWTRIYDPARSEKALEETIAKNVQRFLLQKFKKEPVVEVVIGE